MSNVFSRSGGEGSSADTTYVSGAQPTDHAKL